MVDGTLNVRRAHATKWGILKFKSDLELCGFRLGKWTFLSSLSPLNCSHISRFQTALQTEMSENNSFDVARASMFDLNPKS